MQPKFWLPEFTQEAVTVRLVVNIQLCGLRRKKTCFPKFCSIIITVGKPRRTLIIECCPAFSSTVERVTKMIAAVRSRSELLAAGTELRSVKRGGLPSRRGIG